ncbi:MAG: hypothetical protein GVY28_05335, partial [Alphaproteobacteria bacterium]|nr:hypothetical protein [Alphaproteobacteria bacterium]
MNWMLVVAMGLVAVTTLGVARIWGRAAGAAACAVLGTLCLPPVMLLGPGVLWEDVLIAAGLIGVLAWGSVRSTWPVRLQIADLFMLGLVALPPLSVVVNGQALDAAGVELLEMTTMWAVAYVAGRWLVRDPADLQRVALVVVLALAAYAPLCVIESMTRPALAERLFGLDGPNVTHTKMLGNFIGPRGYRPYVFTEPFFQLTMLQAAGIVLAAGLWLCRLSRVTSKPAPAAAVPSSDAASSRAAQP